MICFGEHIAPGKSAGQALFPAGNIPQQCVQGRETGRPAGRGDRPAMIDPFQQVGLAGPDHLVLAEDDADTQTGLG